MTVSQPDFGARFELKRAKGGHLRLGKCPDITLTKGRIRLELVRTFCNGLFNLCGGELKTRRRSFVELRAEFPNRIEDTYSTVSGSVSNERWPSSLMIFMRSNDDAN